MLAQLSPHSVLSSGIDINPQTKVDTNVNLDKVLLDIQMAAQISNTDTVTISVHALKLSKGL